MYSTWLDLHKNAKQSNGIFWAKKCLLLKWLIIVLSPRGKSFITFGSGGGHMVSKLAFNCDDMSFSPAESTVFILLSCLKRMKINKEEIGNGQIKNTVLYHCPLDEKRLSSVTRLDRYLNVLGDKFAYKSCPNAWWLFGLYKNIIFN